MGMGVFTRTATWTSDGATDMSMKRHAKRDAGMRMTVAGLRGAVRPVDARSAPTGTECRREARSNPKADREESDKLPDGGHGDGRVYTHSHMDIGRGNGHEHIIFISVFTFENTLL